MAFKIDPFVWESSATTGTGALTLSGAVVAAALDGTAMLMRTFASFMSTSDTAWVVIRNRSVASEWEESIVTLEANGTLTRTTVLNSSNANAAVNFSAGTKDVICTLPSGAIGEGGRAVLSAADAAAIRTAAGAEVSGAAAVAVAAHVVAADPHIQYLTAVEGAAAFEALGAAAVAVVAHEGAVNPHPGYLTPAEGDAAYDTIGAATAAVATHAGLSDPHPGYLTSAEGNAAYDALGAAAAAQAASQPVDADLTAISALTTTAFGRALLALADAAAVRTAAGLGTAAVSNTGDFDAAGAAAAAQAASQPLDSDLTAIAALSTTAYGRALLALADAAALRTAGALGTAAVANTGDFATAAQGVTADGALQRSGGTMVGGLTLAGDPDAALKAATKQYVDNLSAGLDVKPSVVVATLADITLSGTQTIDGIAVVVSDRVLVKNQTAPAENGIYLCAAGAWSRATDMDAWTEVPGALTLVERGSTYADSGWVSSADQGGTLGTTAITWSQFFGTGLFDASGAAAAAQAASQPLDSDLTAIAALTTTAFGRAVLALADAAALRTAAALGTAATAATGDFDAAGAAAAALAASQPLDSDLTAIAALTTTAYGRAFLALADAAAARTAAGLGTIATQNTPLGVTVGGTGLTALTANRIPYASATDTLGTSDGLKYNGITLDVKTARGSTNFISLTDTTGGQTAGILIATPLGGGPDLKVGGGADRVILDPAYSVRFTRSTVEWAAGINWSMGATAVGVTGATSINLQTSNDDVPVFNASITTDTVIKAYTGKNIQLAPTSGKVGIRTTAPDKLVEINLGTADAVRYTYNDANGSAATYMDTTLSSAGVTTFTGAGSAPAFSFAQAVTFAARVDLKSYTVATLPAAGAAGGIVYASDAAVAPCLAFSNGTNWKRCDNAATTVV